jgi:hypothetical protein
MVASLSHAIRENLPLQGPDFKLADQSLRSEGSTGQPRIDAAPENPFSHLPVLPESLDDIVPVQVGVVVRAA